MAREVELDTLHLSLQPGSLGQSRVVSSTANLSRSRAVAMIDAVCRFWQSLEAPTPKRYRDVGGRAGAGQLQQWKEVLATALEMRICAVRPTRRPLESRSLLLRHKVHTCPWLLSRPEKPRRPAASITAALERGGLPFCYFLCRVFHHHPVSALCTALHRYSTGPPACMHGDVFIGCSSSISVLTSPASSVGRPPRAG